MVTSSRVNEVAVEYVATTYPNMEPLWQQNILSFEAGAQWANKLLSVEIEDRDKVIGLWLEKSKQWQAALGHLSDKTEERNNTLDKLLSVANVALEKIALYEKRIASLSAELEERNKLLSGLARESVERDKQIARLEAEVTSALQNQLSDKPFEIERLLKEIEARDKLLGLMPGQTLTGLLKTGEDDK